MEEIKSFVPALPNTYAAVYYKDYDSWMILRVQMFYAYTIGDEHQSLWARPVIDNVPNDGWIEDYGHDNQAAVRFIGEKQQCQKWIGDRKIMEWETE